MKASIVDMENKLAELEDRLKKRSELETLQCKNAIFRRRNGASGEDIGLTMLIGQMQSSKAWVGYPT